MNGAHLIKVNVGVVHSATLVTANWPNGYDGTELQEELPLHRPTERGVETDSGETDPGNQVDTDHDIVATRVVTR